MKADERTRTVNLLITNQLLCQLSHIGTALAMLAPSKLNMNFFKPFYINTSLPFGQALDLLVSVSSIRYRTYTSDLSTS